MSLADKIDTVSNGFLAAITAVIVSAAGWFVRRVLTNEKQIALLQAELLRRDQQRNEDRQDVKDVKSDIREMKIYLMENRK